MEIDESDVTHIVKTYYDRTPDEESIFPLESYLDKNFIFSDSSDKNLWYHLKIESKDESKPELTDIIDGIIDNFYNYCVENEDKLSIKAVKLFRTTTNKLSAYTENYRHRTESDSIETIKCNIRLTEDPYRHTVDDILTCYREFQEEEVLTKVGKVCGQLAEFLTTQEHLREKLKDARGKDFIWPVTTCDQMMELNLRILFPQGANDLDEEQSRKWNLANQVLEEYKTSTKDILKQLPEYIIHSDLSNSNILMDVRDQNSKFCIINFSDLQVGPKVAELAHSMLYSVFEQLRRPLKEAIKEIPHWIYRGYHSNPGCSIDDQELSLIPSLMRVRLCQSLLNGLVANKRDPMNDHLMKTNRWSGWDFLELLIKQDPKELIDWWENGPPK